MNKIIISFCILPYLTTLTSCSMFASTKKIIRNNVRYLVGDDYSRVDCFLITNEMINHDSCQANFEVDFKDKASCSFGRSSSLVPYGGDKSKYCKYDAYGVNSKVTPTFICFRFESFENITEIPLTYNIDITILQNFKWLISTGLNIVFWLPNCSIEYSEYMLIKSSVHINLKIHPLDGCVLDNDNFDDYYEFLDAPAVYRCEDGFLVETEQIKTLFVDEPSGEIYE